MDGLLAYICSKANYAHYLFFGLMLLSGLNIPLSEDILLLGGGAIGATCIPEHALRLYLWIYCGAVLSGWESYWIGRALGPRLFNFKLFKYVITPKRLEMIRHFYARFGVFTFILGRFCPGGIRNTLFMSSGLTKMPFWLFAIRDGFAAILSTSVYFWIGYHFATHIDSILFYIKKYSDFLLVLFAGIVLVGLIYVWYTHRPKSNGDE